MDALTHLKVIFRAKSSISKSSLKYVSILYFLDSNQTYSLKIKLSHLKWLMALLVMSFLWSGASVYIIYKLYDKQNHVFDRLSRALTFIFDYQVAHEQVFEKAYPEKETSPYFAEGAFKKENIPIQEKKLAAHTASVPVVKEIEKAAAKPEPINPEPQTAPADAAPTQVKSASSIVIDDALAVNEDDDMISVDFDIKNTGEAEKEEGYILAIAEYYRPDKSSIFLGAPAQIKVNENDGSPKDYKKGYHFQIKNFAHKSFEFQAPVEGGGRFLAVRIRATDLKGNIQQEIKIPVPKNISDSSQRSHPKRESSPNE